MAILRILNSFLIGLLVTTGLFTFMRVITEVTVEAPPVSDVVKLDVTRLVPSEPIDDVKPDKVKIKKPEPLPTLTPFDPTDEEMGPVLVLTQLPRGIGTFGPGSGGGRGGIRPAGYHPTLADRDPIPLVRVDPQYPPQAQSQRLEGWVHVRFTISTAGSVEDASVVESSHAVFERSALLAVARWKYNPSLREGKPVEAPDQRVLLRFQQPER